MEQKNNENWRNVWSYEEYTKDKKDIELKEKKLNKWDW